MYRWLHKYILRQLCVHSYTDTAIYEQNITFNNGAGRTPFWTPTAIDYCSRTSWVMNRFHYCRISATTSKSPPQAYPISHNLRCEVLIDTDYLRIRSSLPKNSSEQLLGKKYPITPQAYLQSQLFILNILLPSSNLRVISNACSFILGRNACIQLT